jgi:hypothetical protein
VGSAEVSFNLEARERFFTLNPPNDVPYLYAPPLRPNLIPPGLTSPVGCGGARSGETGPR